MQPVALSNTIGLWTLYKREVWRFLKVYNQTVLAPMVTTLLFLAIFSLAMGNNQHRIIGEIPFQQFIIPGLVMMAIVQNAFANTSSSLMISKIQGVIIDLLMPPFTAGELTLALVLGGVTRGLMVGIAVALSVWVFVPFEIHHLGLALFYTVAASSLMALAGAITGIWSQSFDQLSAITNYVITPLAFLSGTFYSVHDLPEFWQHLSYIDPLFYMIDGFRYALLGHADGDIPTGIAVMLLMNALLWITTHAILKRGWRLRT